MEGFRSDIFAFLLLACARDWSVSVFDGFCDWSRQEKWWIGWSVITNVIRLIVLVVVVMAKNLQTSSKSPNKDLLSKLYDVMHSEKTTNFLTNAWLATLWRSLAGTDYLQDFGVCTLSRSGYGAQKQLQTEVAGVLKAATLQDLFERLRRLKVVLMKSTACTAYPWLHFERIREVTLRNQIAQGHQLYAHAQVYWQPNDSSSKDVPIGPNGEVLSKFCPTRYLVKDPDTGHFQSNAEHKSGGFMVFGHGMRSCPADLQWSLFLLASFVASNLQRGAGRITPNQRWNSILSWSQIAALALQLTKLVVAGK
jgi:hypothetical protein